MIKSKTKSTVRKVLAKTWRTFERLGFYVIPKTFYGPIPDSVELLAKKPWNEESKMPGVNFSESDMIKFACEVFPDYGRECASWPHKRSELPNSDRSSFYLDNQLFQSGDAEVLYSFIRHFKPRLILEVGSGFSTLVASQAAVANEMKDGHSTVITSIEPFPPIFLNSSIPHLVRLMPKKVQDVELNEFRALKENDILFIDSTHIVKTGGDVNFLYLEVLPILKKGVIVHIHDIFLPRDYTEKMLINMHSFFTEQYLLQAFLINNESWKVIWGSAFMHYRHADLISACFPTYQPSIRYGGSFWIQKVKETF